MAENAKALFERILSEGYPFIRQLLCDRRAEDLWLDFKEKSNRERSGTLDRSDKHNFARALSGFANSSGGVLIWGIGARRTGDTSVAVVDQRLTTPQAFAIILNGLVAEATVPMLSDVRNEVIKVPEEEGGYVVTFIPESTRTPHRAELGLAQYYKRSGDSFRPMEHFDIEDMFGRRHRPELVLDIDHRLLDAGSGIVHQYELIINVRNEGRGFAKYFGLDIDFPKQSIDRSSKADSNRVRMSVDPDNRSQYRLTYRSRSQDDPIFPGETITIFPNNYRAGHLYYGVDDDIFHKYADSDIVFRVYSENSRTRTQTFPFHKLYEY